jgi:uncharacterized protein YbaP (TraB family)
MKQGRLRLLCIALVTVASAVSAADNPGAKSFLWRVSSGDRTVALLGSIHFMKAEAYPLSPAIERAFDGAAKVVFETDIDEMEKAAVSLLAAGTLEGDTTLEDVVDKELYDEVSHRLEDLGMGMGTFAKMKPWMAAMGLTSLELMRGGYLGTEGIDSYFSARAETAGKPQQGLESIEYQVSLFAEMSAAESAEFLSYTLTDLDTMIPLVDEIVAAWTIGDSARIEDLLVDGFEGHEALFDRLVTQRNLRWLPQIEELLRGDADALVVVGSLHLIGEQGLVALLKAKGYEVEQL